MKLILGSKSPRRKELLAAMGYSFEIRTKDTDESYPDSLDPKTIAAYVVSKKSAALQQELAVDEVLVCADTTVVLGNKQFGKPIDREDAIHMLTELSNCTHQVITAFSVTTQQKTVVQSVTTEVTFKPLSLEEISHYIDTFHPFDKAGSYGIQEWIGYIGITTIQGSYTNVVGLPTAEVAAALAEFQFN